VGLARASTTRTVATPAPAGKPRKLHLWSLVAGVSATLACLLRYGYQFGFMDQTVLSPRGIAQADPGAHANDWFARSVPQPHWLFDAVTWAGERLGALPWVYLAYWLAGLLAFGVAAVWLTERFLPGRPWLASLLGPLVVLGPEKVLGSTTPLLGLAIPHMLGGCLAFMALSGLVTGRWRAAAGAGLLAGAVHVQHGANLAPVFLAAAALAAGASRRHRLLAAGVGVILVAAAPAVAGWRGLHASGNDWLQTCQRMIPYHCDATTWPLTYVASGGVVLALALGLAVALRTHWRTLGPAVVLPGLGLAVAVVAEWAGLGELGRLAQRLNVHRLATFAVPFAAFGLLFLVARPVRPRRLLWAVVCGGTVLVWSTMTSSVFSGAWSRPDLFLDALGVGLALALWVARSNSAAPADSRRRILVVALVVGLGLLLGSAQGKLGRLGYDRSNPAIDAALSVGEDLPEDAVIAAPPGIFWLRAVSRRAVVADCKAIPYGGKPWQEYQARIEALGGRGCKPRSAEFAHLTPAAVESLQPRYGVTHVLLYPDDPKAAYARQHWRLVHQVGPRPFPFLERGWLVFELPGFRFAPNAPMEVP
jgi:hypothetical protein